MWTEERSPEERRKILGKHRTRKRPTDIDKSADRETSGDESDADSDSDMGEARCIAAVGGDTPNHLLKENRRFANNLVNYSPIATLRIRAGNEYVIPFVVEETTRNEAAIAMYATETIGIPPGHCNLVPINACRNTHGERLTWGRLYNTGEEADFIVAKHVMDQN
jgi:hypothetical protein